MYICEICGKEFKSQKALHGHKAHCGQNLLECPICHKKLDKCVFVRHLKIHDEEHECINCEKIIPKNKKFCSSSCAASYNNKITKTKNRKSICKNCGKEFVPSYSSTGKFCSSKCSNEYRFKEKDKKYLKGQIHDMHTLKNHFLFHNPNKCAICGLSKWQDKDITLVLDHIDGNPENDNPSNLRLICPNCDSQLSTFKGRNRGYGRFSRRQRYKENKSF